MSHMTEHLWLELIGALIGAIGVSISIYLQLITRKHCPKKYVIIFLVFGITMIMIHSNPFLASTNNMITIRIIGYTILAVMEIGAAYMVWKRLHLENPVEEIHDEFFPAK